MQTIASSALFKSHLARTFKQKKLFSGRLIKTFTGMCMVIGLCFYPCPSSATLALKASVDSLVEQSDRVVYAEVYAVEDVSQRGQNGEIYTRILLDVFEYWKGNGPNEITVQTLGGSFQDLTLKVAGTPQFKRGQKVVLFLKSDPVKALNYIVALAQGVFYVDETQRHWKEHSVIHLNPLSSSNPYIYQDLTGLSFYLPSFNSKKPTLIDADQVQPLLRTFNDLKKQVAQALVRPMTVDDFGVVDLTLLPPSSLSK